MKRSHSIQRAEHLWWGVAALLVLSAFSFLSGLGMRGLYSHLRSPVAVAVRDNHLPRIASADPAVAAPDIQPEWLFREVMSKLRNHYVEPLPPSTALASGSVREMLDDLGDPNTRLMSPVELDATRAAVNGQFSGLGAVLTLRRHPLRRASEIMADDAPPADPAPGKKKSEPVNPGMCTITVVSVAPGGPADKAGIKPGDRITHFDGHWIAPQHVSYRVLTQLTDPLGPQDGQPRDEDEVAIPPRAKTAEQEAEEQRLRKQFDEDRERWKGATDIGLALEALHGGATGKHKLTIERGKQAQESTVEVELGTTQVETFSSRQLNPKTGYIQLLSFNGSTGQRVLQALKGFQQAGVKNLVIDLRNSPGGSLEAVKEVAGHLLGEAKIAVLRERDSARKLVDRALMTKGGVQVLKPTGIVVLVDGGTAGGSEILAAALRDVAGARLLGTGTFGDGTFQDLVPLEDGSGFTLTRARMLSAKAVEFEGKGLQPDAAPEGDPIEAATKLLAAGVAVGKV